MRKNIVFYYTIISPYLVDRLNSLDTRENYILAVGNRTIDNRPGWNYWDEVNMDKVLLKAKKYKRRRKFTDLGYSIDYTSFIPFRLLPFSFQIRVGWFEVCSVLEVLFLLPAKFLRGIKIILRVEDTPHSTRGHGRVSRVVKRFVYGCADQYLVYSKDSELFLKSIGIQEGITHTRWSYPELSEYDKKELRVPNSPKTFVFVGSLIEGKGLGILLEAWRMFIEDNEGELRIIGDGPLKNLLVEKNIPDVEFLGSIAHSEVMKEFAKSDIFILPTYQDLFSLTLVEALSRGCYGLTTPYNGARELISEGENGDIFELTPESLFAAMSRVNKKILDRESIKASVKHLSPEQVAVDLNKFYQDIS